MQEHHLCVMSEDRRKLKAAVLLYLLPLCIQALAWELRGNEMCFAQPSCNQWKHLLVCWYRFWPFQNLIPYQKMKTFLKEEWTCLLWGFVKNQKAIVKRHTYTTIRMGVLFSWLEEPGSIFLQSDLWDYFVDFFTFTVFGNACNSAYPDGIKNKRHLVISVVIDLLKYGSSSKSWNAKWGQRSWKTEDWEDPEMWGFSVQNLEEIVHGNHY